MCWIHLLTPVKMIKLVILLSVALTASAQDLAAGADSSGIRLFRDRGGTGRREVTIYEPVRAGPDWFLLGQRAQGNYNNMEKVVHSFRDQSARKDTLRRPTGFKFIWDDRDSSFEEDGSVWRAICQNGYDALGDMLATTNRLSQAPPELFAKFRCVADDKTAPCDLGNKIWDNAGSWGKYYISMWEARPRSGQFQAGFYYAKNQHNQKPDVRPRCLKSNAVRVQYTRGF